MKKSKLLIILVMALAGFMSVTFTVFSFVREVRKDKLPVLGQVYNFSLIDTEGQAFELENLKGRVWVADFFFTTCSDICPRMTKNMAALNRSFEGVKDVRLVSVSVNPEFDTAATLKSFSRLQKASSNWIFLTGERQVITDLALKSFRFGHKDEPVFHSSYFSLVDRNGLIRGYYDGTNTDEVNRLFRETALLLKE